MKSTFDTKDLRILEILQEDARASLADIGRRVHLSQPAVAERVRRLEQSRVITGYHASVDPDRLGYGITAFVRVRQGIHDTPVCTVAARLPQVIECHTVTGEECSILKVLAGSVGELEKVIAAFASCGTTSTSIVLSSPLPRRALRTAANAVPNP